MRDVVRRWGLGLCIIGLLGCGDDGGSMDDANSSGPTDDGTPLECGDAVHSGHIVIESEADLEQLDGIAVIEGELQVANSSFTDLDFLGCVQEVGDELTLFSNDSLQDTSGLDQLERTGGGIVISENDALTDIDGFASLLEVGDSLIIRGNPSLSGLSGMQRLSAIETSLIIRENDALLHIDGLRALRRVGALFAVTHNPSLCISSINAVGEGIIDPAQPRDNWSTRANDDSC